MDNLSYKRLGTELINNQGCLMKCIEYNTNKDIVVEFQDEYKHKVHTSWYKFQTGSVKNAYFPDVYDVGSIGNKYPSKENGHNTKEYITWRSVLKRCFDNNLKEKCPTYKDVICCKEWLLFENFYEWLHSQENFEKWKVLDRSAIDKDIIVKGNKIYSPDTCCLVPDYVNLIFTKNQERRGKYPIGVCYHKSSNSFHAVLTNNTRTQSLKYYKTPEEAFYFGYKPAKEAYIKQVAQEEYGKGNITKKCYEAMINYQVEIAD